jgi:hypothetical protein
MFPSSQNRQFQIAPENVWRVVSNNVLLIKYFPAPPSIEKRIFRQPCLMRGNSNGIAGNFFNNFFKMEKAGLPA